MWKMIILWIFLYDMFYLADMLDSNHFVRFFLYFRNFFKFCERFFWEF